jgi:hypothetical protein
MRIALHARNQPNGGAHHASRNARCGPRSIGTTQALSMSQHRDIDRSACGAGIRDSATATHCCNSFEPDRDTHSLDKVGMSDGHAFC